MNEQKFTGALSEIVNDAIEIFQRLASWKNQTIEIQPKVGFGDPVEGTDEYTGCIGLIQKNQSDFMLMPMDYPSNIINISHAIVFASSYLDIGSTYMVGNGKTTSILSMFKSFDPSLYCTIVSTLVAIWFLIWIRQSIRQRFADEMKKLISFNSFYTRKRALMGFQNRSTIKLAMSNNQKIKRKRKMKKIMSTSMYKVILHFFQVDSFAVG